MTDSPEAATAPAAARWPSTSAAWRRSSRSAVVGTGADAWALARQEVLHWGVKTRGGFQVHPPGTVAVGARPTITIGLHHVVVHEPVEVVAVVDLPDRVGFAYRALPGHPVRGEEAFVVHRDGDAVVLTVRSLTRRSPDQPWRMLWPLLLIAQGVVHRRYLRALCRPLSDATRRASSRTP